MSHAHDPYTDPYSSDHWAATPAWASVEEGLEPPHRGVHRADEDQAMLEEAA